MTAFAQRECWGDMCDCMRKVPLRSIAIGRGALPHLRASTGVHEEGPWRCPFWIAQTWGIGKADMA